jgi:aryl-alcohol dehydrogenase-like predicted oxidoreductase
MAVVALRVLEGGLLTSTPAQSAGQNWRRRSELKRAAVLGNLSDAEPCATALAIRFAISNPQVSTVVVGLSDTSQIEQATDYANRGPLAPHVLAQIEQFRASDFGKNVESQL